MPTAAAAKGSSVDGIAETGSRPRIFIQGFLVGEGMIVIDLDRHLHCLSLYPTLMFVTMSSSSSSSQMMGGTISPTSTSGSMLEVDSLTSMSISMLVIEDEDVEEAKASGEGNVYGGFGGI